MLADMNEVLTLLSRELRRVHGHSPLSATPTNSELCLSTRYPNSEALKKTFSFGYAPLNSRLFNEAGLRREIFPLQSFCQDAPLVRGMNMAAHAM